MEPFWQRLADLVKPTDALLFYRKIVEENDENLLVRKTLPRFKKALANLQRFETETDALVSNWCLL